jgi:hypothetical protein
MATPSHNKLHMKINNHSRDSSPSPTGKKIESLASKLALLPQAKSTLVDEKSQPLVMSDAAMQKRLKNLEEYVNQKRKLKDREDAMSVASQLIDTYSKQGDVRSQTSK